MDTSCVSIKVLPPVDDSIEDITENAHKQQMENMKQMYKKFKKEKS